MKTSPAMCSALRLVRRSPLRTTIVVGAIAVPTALATASNVAGRSGAAALTWSAVAVALAVLLATQSSPEPLSLATIGAWYAAGASPSSSRRPHHLAGLLLCWGGTAVGIGFGSLLGLAAASNRATWGQVLLLGSALALVGAVALLPSPHLHRSVSKHRLVATRRVKLAGGLALVGAAAGTIDAAGLVRTDRDVFVVVPIAATVTILVASVALRPALRGILAVSRSIPALRPLLAAAARHRTPAVVRAALVAAMVVASTAAVLGASVGGRTARHREAVAELKRVPAVPPTVMAVTVPITGTASGDGLPGRALPSEAVATIRRQYPDAEVTPVARVVPTLDPPSLLCSLFDARCALPVIVADPRLASVYGQAARPSDLALFFGSPVRHRLRELHPSLSAPLPEDLIVRRIRGGSLPPATFQGLVALEVSPGLVAELGLPTEVRTVFVTRNTPFTAEERSALRSLVSTSPLRASLATAVTADNRSGDLRSPLGQVPWAPTASSTQWSIAAIATILALLVGMGTGIVDALDRRRDNARLELLGATPNQVRGAAALYSGLVLGVSAVFAAAAVTALVAFGVDRFSAAEPAIAVPFVFPLAQIAFLVAGVPLLGALIAAASARAARQSTPPRRCHDITMRSITRATRNR